MGISDILFQRNQDKAAKNLEAGLAFLETNKANENVVVRESGLQYEVLKQGDGEFPTQSSNVTCHYHGTTIDGSIFDSSVQRGQPATFPLNRVISGWTEGVPLMQVGSKFRFFIPPSLAYGDRQVGSDIGPNSTLIFEVELLGIK